VTRIAVAQTINPGSSFSGPFLKCGVCGFRVGGLGLKVRDTNGSRVKYQPRYGVAMISRLLKIVGLFCKRAL